MPMILPPLTHEDFIAVEKEACSRSLSTFIKRAWHVLEPNQPYIHGWHIDATSEHLEAVTRNEIIRLAIAMPPGCMKSLLVGVFWPAWEWGPKNLPSYRYLGTSHSAPLAIRDNLRAKRLIQSEWYQLRWGDTVILTSDQNEKIKYENTATGFRQAMAFTGLTGSRGDRVLMDDVLSVDDASSDAVRLSTNTTFLEAVPTRLNNPEFSAIINIQQRLHPEDTIGIAIAKELGYDYLVLPMEFEKGTRCSTSIGFVDPREKEDELLFPERFPRHVVERDKKALGKFATASQMQQRPVPRGGGMFHRDWFEIVNDAPATVKWVRGWDLAATEAKQGQRVAFTAGVKLGVDIDGTFYIGHCIRGQWSPQKVESTIKRAAKDDGVNVIVDLPQDPGQAGKFQVRYLITKLAGYEVKFGLESGSKELRAGPLASQAEAGNVKIVRGSWNDDFLSEIEVFPASTYKDQVDAATRAFARCIVPVVNNDFSAPIIVSGD